MQPTYGLMRRREFTAGIGLATLAGSRRAAAATRIVLGYTATLGFNGAFIAKDRGFFAQRGLDVELLLITLNSNIPGAMMGGSIQVGGPTPTSTGARSTSSRCRSLRVPTCCARAA